MNYVSDNTEFIPDYMLPNAHDPNGDNNSHSSQTPTTSHLTTAETQHETETVKNFITLETYELRTNTERINHTISLYKGNFPSVVINDNNAPNDYADGAGSNSNSTPKVSEIESNLPSHSIPIIVPNIAPFIKLSLIFLRIATLKSPFRPYHLANLLTIVAFSVTIYLSIISSLPNLLLVIIPKILFMDLMRVILLFVPLIMYIIL